MDLTGLNIDGRQIARAKQKVQARESNHLQFMEGNACAMPFPNESFDAVSAVECIFHFPSRLDFFKEAWRVLKPGGALTISDFVPRALFRRWTGSKRTQAMLAPLFGPVKMDHILKDYRRLASETGFTSLVEKNITANTIPTYPFLRKLQPALGNTDVPDDWGNYKTEWVSRLGWIGYWVLAWRKSSL